MPSYDEIQASLSASWQLMQGKADAVRKLDLSADGFWNSFFAIVVALPALFVIWTDEANQLAPGADNVAGRIGLVLRFAVIEGIAWVSPLIAIGYVLHMVGRRDRVMPFIIANNWGQALLVWIILPVIIVHSAMPAVADVAVMVMLFFFIASLVLFWRLNNAVLGMGPVVPAVAIAAMVFLSLLIDYVLRVVLAIPTPAA